MSRRHLCNYMQLRLAITSRFLNQSTYNNNDTLLKESLGYTTAVREEIEAIFTAAYVKIEKFYINQASRVFSK